MTGGGRETCEIASYAGEEFLDHSKVACAYGEVVNVDAVTWIRNTVPGDMVDTKLTVTGTVTLLVNDVYKVVE